MKYLVVTGGVVSGLGKGISISSLGVLLQAAGIKVTAIKIDPYLVRLFVLRICCVRLFALIWSVLVGEERRREGERRREEGHLHLQFGCATASSGD